MPGEVHVRPGLSILRDQLNSDGYADLSLDIYPQTPGLPIYRLVVKSKLHGVIGEAEAQLQVDDYGAVTIRIHESVRLKALVVTDAGQAYPAP